MKKPLVLVLLSSILVIGGVCLSNKTAPLGSVYAEDIDGDGIDDGDVEEGDGDYIDYTGDIDIYTGLPTYLEEEKQSGYVKVTDGCEYDLNNHYFCYPTGNGGTFCCTVADGMVTTSPVNFAKSGEYNISIYKDGSKLNGLPKSVSEAGSYTAITWDENSETQLMTFRIVKPTTGKLAQYVLPSGFTVKSVTIDGVEADKGFGIVDMTRDGYYDIKYNCNATGITYNLVCTVDHIPPQITLTGVDKENKAKGPVQIQGLSNGDVVNVYLNDNKTNLKSDNTLTESGTYRLLVMDQAGNVTQKDFQIQLYLNIKSIFLFGAFVLLIVGVIVALYITRKNLRVR